MNGPTGPKGPQGPQGATGPQGLGYHADGSEERFLREMRNDAFRQDGANTKRFSIHRDEVDAPPAQGNGPQPEPEPIHPGPTLKHFAEKKIEKFFKATTHFRNGLPVGCPICNAAMIVRTRGRDGRAFLGCTAWPKCSGSWDIPESAQVEAKRWERTMMTSVHTQAMMPTEASTSSLAKALADEAADKVYCAEASKDLDFSMVGMPSGRITEIRGNAAYVGGQAVGKVMKDAIDEELEKVPARKRGKVPMKEAEEAMTDGPSNSLKDRLARSAKKAPYRVARMRALTEGKKAILGALRKRVQPATFDLLEAFLDTDAGQGAILGIVGLAGPYTPKLGKNKHVQAVCEEFLDEGVAKGANEVFGLLGLILEPVLKSVMSSLPEVEEIADKVVPKRRKKRVATQDLRVSSRERESRPEVEDEEESEPRPKNALRAVTVR